MTAHQAGGSRTTLRELLAEMPDPIVTKAPDYVAQLFGKLNIHETSDLLKRLDAEIAKAEANADTSDAILTALKITLSVLTT